MDKTEHAYRIAHKADAYFLSRPEIKLVQAADVEGNPALEQIPAKGYSEKYQGRPGMTVHELGLIFSRQTRNLIALDGRKVGNHKRTYHLEPQSMRKPVYCITKGGAPVMDIIRTFGAVGIIPAGNPLTPLVHIARGVVRSWKR